MIVKVKYIKRCQYIYIYIAEAFMSQVEEFQSAQKQCSLEIVHVVPYHANSLTPRKRIVQNIAWKLQKTKRINSSNYVPIKFDTKNIAFKTDDFQLSDEEEQINAIDKSSSNFHNKYQTNQEIYRKEKATGSNWLGKTEHFASIFVNPNVIANSDISALFNKKYCNSLPSTEPFTFISEFESGNLFCVFKVNEHEYDLLLQNDINSKGNTQWFYFQMINIPANTNIKLNIVNMMKSDSLFNYGMQPCVYSTQAQKKIGQGWIRSGTAIKYFRNQNKVDGSKRYYYTLTFTLMTPFQNDTLKVAHSYPYSVQDLNKYLERLEKKNGKKMSISRESVGQTIGKNNIELIKVKQENPRKKTPRQLIIITARQHPGQTPGSFVCEGFLQFITSDEKQASYLRKNYQIHVLPMLNPDGVLVGNYRTNLCGVDLNRRWDGSKSKLAVETMLVKKYLLDIVKYRDVAFMVDLHGHSRKLFSFFYGNSNKQKPLQVRIFPYICSKMSEQTIRFEDCSFTCEQQKRKTARVLLANKFKISNVFTFETSFFGYVNNKKQRVHFTEDKLKQLGGVLGRSMFIHQRYKTCGESLQALLVKKYLDELHKKPQLIECGEKAGSGSETQPQKQQINEEQLQKLYNDFQLDEPLLQQAQMKDPQKTSIKKEVHPKDIHKQCRQLQSMNIPRVNSIFPNDVIALMPIPKCSLKCQEKYKKKQCVNVTVQTEEARMPNIQMNNWKYQKNKQDRTLPIRKSGIKNQTQGGPSSSRSNIFKAVSRPKTTNNPYLQANLFMSFSNKIPKKIHDGNMEIRGNSQFLKMNRTAQTILTFPPEIGFMSKTLGNLSITPISKGVQIFSKQTHSNFASFSPQFQPFSAKINNQSFKIGLRALNVETWRMKKKNLQ